MKKFNFYFCTLLLLISLSGCSFHDTNTTTDTPASVSSPSDESGNALAETSETDKPLEASLLQREFTDLSYGSQSATQKLDLYLPPQGDGPFPIIILIHGGYFISGSKKGADVKPVIQAGLKEGYAIASVDYRLSGEATFPAAVSDVRAAVRFLKANATYYHLNSSEFIAWGISAGGNLASMLGTTGGDQILNGDNPENLDQSSCVQAVVDWYGLIDFTLVDQQFSTLGITPLYGLTSISSSPESKYVGQPVDQDIAYSQRTNPETYITSDDPPFLIQHGDQDANVPFTQSIHLAQKLKQVIGDKQVTLDILKGAGHGTSQFTTQENLDHVFSFLNEILSSPN